MQDVEQQIRERAYHLWDADGRREGNELDHWLAAQREILAASLQKMVKTSKTKKQSKALKRARAA